MLEPMHLIADLVCSDGLTDRQNVEDFMRAVIQVCGLTIKHFHIEEFSNGSEFGPGITGIAILSESHMVVHTAPERRNLNLDLFSCRPFRQDLLRDKIEDHFGVPTAVRRWDLISR